MEANACGTVVVGADVPGLRDSIHNQETGLLVPHGDYLAFAEAIIQLLTDVHLQNSKLFSHKVLPLS